MGQRGWSLVVAIALAMPGLVLAADPWKTDIVTAGEFARLPDYCRDTQTYAGHSGTPTPRQAHWLSLVGDTFWHMHHYCWGMLKAMRAEGPNISQDLRNSLIESAIGECQYVVDRAPPDFPLLPEIFFRMGTYNAALARPGVAINYFDRSRAVKPDYWPPYLEIAKVNAQLGRRQAAIDILTEGVRLMPDEHQLVDELRRLEASPDPASGPRRK